MNVCAEPVCNTIFDYATGSCLVYGIGNAGRQDDGLGWAFVDWLESSGLCPGTEFVRHYQLMPEDADLISRKERVLFVDATKATDVDSVRVETVVPRFDLSFTSHALSVPTVVDTCRICFGRAPRAQLLTIRGYEWALKVGLTEAATRNLKAAKQLFVSRGIGHD